MFRFLYSKPIYVYCTLTELWTGMIKQTVHVQFMQTRVRISPSNTTISLWSILYRLNYYSSYSTLW